MDIPKKDEALIQLETSGHFELMLNATDDCIKLLHLDGSIFKINQAGRTALGLGAGSLPGTTLWVSLLPEDVQPVARRALKKACSGKKTKFIGKSRLHGRPEVIWENHLTPVMDQQGELSFVLCLSRDVTRQIAAERKLAIASATDPLTQLPNRRALHTNFGRIHNRNKKARRKTGLLLFDIDDFKYINDTHGHAAGDHVLRVIAQKINKREYANQYMARLGGDEFAIVITHEHPLDFESAARRILSDTNGCIEFKGIPLKISISIGGAVAENERGTDTLAQLMKASDAALYVAKKRGKATFHLNNSP